MDPDSKQERGVFKVHRGDQTVCGGGEPCHQITTWTQATGCLLTKEVDFYTAPAQLFYRASLHHWPVISSQVPRSLISP